MTELLERILRAYGQTVTLTHAGETAEGKAFLQAMEEAGKAEPYAVSPLGFADGLSGAELPGTERPGGVSGRGALPL